MAIDQTETPMTDRLSALRALAERVEAGDIPDTGVDRFSALPKRGGGVYADPNWYDAHSAYWEGSLDAAKALHEALFPGWPWSIKTLATDAVQAWANHAYGLRWLGHMGTTRDKPARALLLYDLRALIAQEEANGGAGE